MFGDKLKNLINKSDNKKEKDKLLEDLAGESGNKANKKKIENLVFFIILAIITIVIINIIWNGKKTTIKQNGNLSNKQLASTNSKNNTVNAIDMDSDTLSNQLEQKLEAILSKIQGVGNVNVFINYSESSEVVAMYNENSKVSTTEESDKSGGTRKIQETDTQKDIIYKEDSGEKIPITQKIIQPKVEGAIITAKGASDVNTKTNIIQAVEAVTGLATHKIQVFETN